MLIESGLYNRVLVGHGVWEVRDFTLRFLAIAYHTYSRTEQRSSASSFLKFWASKGMFLTNWLLINMSVSDEILRKFYKKHSFLE